MDIYVCNKNYFKESKEVQTAILKSMQDLYKRISTYEAQNIAFEKIYNDDNVKYDKHGKFYTYKSQKSNVQLRILYSYLIINDIPIIVVADFYIKKKNKKDYIRKFDYINTIDPNEVANKAFWVKSVSNCL